MRFETDGTVTVAVGTESNGQGHETAFAQIAADLLGVLAERALRREAEQLIDLAAHLREGDGAGHPRPGRA